MKGLRARLDYWLKHNYFFNRLFAYCAGLFMRIMGLFIKTDEKLILFSGHARKYNDSPKVIYEHMLADKRFSDFKFVWALENPDETVIPGNPRKIKTDSFEYFKETLRAKYWVTCVNIERGLHYKKKHCVYLNTWHATPVKHMGNSANGRRDYDFSNVDFFCAAGEYEKKIYMKDLLIKAQSVLNSGLPRNDELYDVNPARIERLRIKFNIPQNKKVILYAPTWRDSEDGGKTYKLMPPINLKYWMDELGSDYVVFLRTHAYTNKLYGIEFNDFIRDYSDYPNVNELLIVSDIMISDYSAIIFDYCILERPLFCYGYDYEEFEKKRGFYVSLDEEMPCGVQRTEKELIQRIKKMNYSEDSKAVKEFKDKYMQYGGHAAEICVNALAGECK